MKLFKGFLCMVLSFSILGIDAIHAEETGSNGISEEGKKYLQSEEYKEKIKAKNEWMSKQPMLYRSAGRMNIKHRKQYTNTWCGPATAQMIIEYVTGVIVTQGDLAVEARTDVGKVGTYVDDLAIVVATYTDVPYESASVYNGNFYNNVKTDFDHDFPVAYDVDAYVLDKFYGKPTGHYLVGAGYSSSGSLYFVDPFKDSDYNGTASQSLMLEALKGNGGYYIY